jgi:hypothetical protein
MKRSGSWSRFGGKKTPNVKDLKGEDKLPIRCEKKKKKKKKWEWGSFPNRIGAKEDVWGKIQVGVEGRECLGEQFVPPSKKKKRGVFSLVTGRLISETIQTSTFTRNVSDQ